MRYLVMCDLTVLNMPTNIDNLELVEVFQRLGRARDRVLNSGIRTPGGRTDQLNFSDTHCFTFDGCSTSQRTSCYAARTSMQYTLGFVTPTDDTAGHYRAER